jgi:CheY-like chemotaxis protein
MPPMAKPLVAIVAEIDANLRNFLRLVLRDRYFTVHPCRNGQEALEYAERHEANLILLNIDLLGKQAFGACTAIRKLPAHRDTPIVLTYVKPLDPRVHERLLDRLNLAVARVGATALAAKPISEDDLQALVDRHVLRASSAVPAGMAIAAGMAEARVPIRAAVPARRTVIRADRREG